MIVGLCEDLKRGLVGWWRFDETQGNVAHDSSGKGNHGTVKGDAKWTEGRIGGALEFDGRRYVDVPSSVTEFGRASFTVSVWLKTTPNGAAVLSKSNNDTTWNKGEKQFYVSACATPPHLRNREKPIGSANLVGCFSGYISGSAVVSDGKWHNIAWTWGAVAKGGAAYVDSAPGVRHVSYGLVADNARSKVRIGFKTSGEGTANFIGLLDDVRIYNRALSGDEVKALAAMGDAAAKEPGLKPEPGAPPKTLTLDLGGGVRMEMIYIKPGVFVMGSDSTQEGDSVGWQQPKHTVTITKGFYLGKYEVTQVQFQAVMGSNPSTFKGPHLPVEALTRGAAVEFCRKVSKKTGREVRLPTEAEWEYACRAGTDTDWSHGNDPATLVEYAWSVDNAGGRRHAVGQKKPNPWGLYDIHGNCFEWVADKYSRDYYALSAKEDPPGPTRGQRSLRGRTWRERYVLRGRCWKVGAEGCTSAFRLHGVWRYPNWGFRVAVSVTAQGR